jgi:hypothetical protein
MQEPQHLSYSKLRHLKKSEDAFIYACETKLEPTDAMIFGSLCHTLLLEPKKFDDKYIIKPAELNRRGSNKIEHDAFFAAAAAKNLTVIKQADLDKAKALAKSTISKFPVLTQMKSIEENFETYYLSNNIDYKFKGIIDAIHDRLGIFEIKIVNAASPAQKIQSVVYSSCYHLQAWIYRFSQRQTKPGMGYNWLFVENEPPYEAWLYVPREEIFEDGHALCDLLLAKYENLKAKQFKTEGHIMSLNRPAWAKADLENEEYLINLNSGE